MQGPETDAPSGTPRTRRRRSPEAVATYVVWGTFLGLVVVAFLIGSPWNYDAEQCSSSVCGPGLLSALLLYYGLPWVIALNIVVVLVVHLVRRTRPNRPRRDGPTYY